jgi:hypothetical protein
MALRATENSDKENIDNTIIPFDNDDDTDNQNLQPEDVTLQFPSETLIMTCHQIISSWHKDIALTGSKFPALKITWNHSAHLQNSNLLPIDMTHTSFHNSGQFYNTPPTILQQWEQIINDKSSSTASTNAYEIDPDDSINFDTNGAGLQPSLISMQNQFELKPFTVYSPNQYFPTRNHRHNF